MTDAAVPRHADSNVAATDASGHQRSARNTLDVERVRADFPILHQELYGKPLAYLDNAASSQKPRPVIAAMTEAMETYYANVHRGVHRLSQVSTDHYEGAREKVARFINAPRTDEVIFTRGATEAINLVASSYGRAFLKPGQEVLITALEHHSNIVPWQLLRDQLGITLRVAPVEEDGSVRPEAVIQLINENTGMVAISQVSNALGSVLPVRQIADAAHASGIPVLVDGCQAIPHQKVDVQALGADFYAFSGHKMYGPTGIGVLWGRHDLLTQMPPYQGGGEMITSVSFEESTFKGPPHGFEAGTPAIVEAIGLGAAADWLEAHDLEAVAAHEHRLLEYATERLSAIEGLRIWGRAENKAAIVSFTMDQAHAHDVGTIVDRAGVAIRAGHHCAQPLMERYGLSSTVRASFGIYNTEQEVDQLADALQVVKELFG
ncbi:cysteine desulfurase [Rhodovibrio sodomensis]|uniref:Cysteine desulfurase n=1 Tax=Rhodovibrio sodomensis TaxID=1088 RepID=A0ABS1DE50_9PROT|nr:cysteine desulfurase [Rhodovibrio sodomensis]MBK1668474.1 cysteine desulfurase [Rhodovibrio sodomensis]